MWRIVCRTMPATDTFPLVDRLVPGGLVAFLKAARDRGDSYETIAQTLRTEHDVPATSETVRRWCLRPAPSTEVGES